MNKTLRSFVVLCLSSSLAHGLTPDPTPVATVSEVAVRGDRRLKIVSYDDGTFLLSEVGSDRSNSILTHSSDLADNYAALADAADPAVVELLRAAQPGISKATDDAAGPGTDVVGDANPLYSDQDYWETIVCALFSAPDPSWSPTTCYSQGAGLTRAIQTDASQSAVFMTAYHTDGDPNGSLAHNLAEWRCKGSIAGWCYKGWGWVSLGTDTVGANQYSQMRITSSARKQWRSTVTPAGGARFNYMGKWKL